MPAMPTTEPHFATFEPEAQNQLYIEIKKAKEQQAAKGVSPLPIFVITCDRLSVLIKSLLSFYKSIAEPITIIIHDNCTTYTPTLHFLNRLRLEGIPVYSNPVALKKAAALSSVSETIARWYENHDSEHYIVTDPDIEIESGAKNLLQPLRYLLEKFQHIDAVGPMLRRDDIPDFYPLKNMVLEQQEKLYLAEKHWVMKWGTRALLVQSGWIDTAFALYRRSFKFRSLNRSIQTYDPYIARHLDWYINPSCMTPDQIYYKKKNNPVGHWSSTWFPDVNSELRSTGRDMMLPSSYKIVRRTPAHPDSPT